MAHLPRDVSTIRKERPVSKKITAVKDSFCDQEKRTNQAALCVQTDAGRSFFRKGESKMENRIAVISILVHDRDATDAVNHLLHEYGDCIIGRMGIPHRDRCSIITIVMDCAADQVSALSGKLGRIDQVHVRSMMAR